MQKKKKWIFALLFLILPPTARRDGESLQHKQKKKTGSQKSAIFYAEVNLFPGNVEISAENLQIFRDSG